MNQQKAKAIRRIARKSQSYIVQEALKAEVKNKFSTRYRLCTYIITKGKVDPRRAFLFTSQVFGAIVLIAMLLLALTGINQFL
jgi:hypothetical protein